MAQPLGSMASGCVIRVRPATERSARPAGALSFPHDAGNYVYETTARQREIPAADKAQRAWRAAGGGDSRQSADRAQRAEMTHPARTHPLDGAQRAAFTEHRP